MGFTLVPGSVYGTSDKSLVIVFDPSSNIILLSLITLTVLYLVSAMLSYLSVAVYTTYMYLLDLYLHRYCPH